MLVDGRHEFVGVQRPVVDAGQFAPVVHEGGHREADGAEGRGEHAIGITTLKVGDAEVPAL